MLITKKLIESGKSEHGGWTSQQLALLRVAWPPKAGWQAACIGKSITDANAALFLDLATTEKPQKTRPPRRKNRDKIPKKTARERIEHFRNREEELRAWAMNLGLDLRVTNRTPHVLHVMLDFFGERIINWWPSNGTIYAFDGLKDNADDIEGVLDLAKQAMERHPDVVAHSVIG